MQLELLEGYGYISSIVGICTKDGAILCSDSRMTAKVDGEIKVFDDCKKIFKVNDRLLFGASGFFKVNDRLIEPFVGLDCLSLNVDTALKAIEDYMNNLRTSGDLHECAYVLCGEDDSGNYCIVTVRYDEKENNIFFGRRYGYDNVAIHILPPSVESNKEKWIEALNDRVNDKSRRIEEQLVFFVYDISKVSDLTNDKIIYRKITNAHD